MTEIALDEPELRLFVDSASGLGHQASSLVVLESIIAAPSRGGLGYRGRVTIVYDGGSVTRRKLSHLFPRLAGVRGSLGVEDATVRLVPVERTGTLPTVSLGLTGGADGRHRRLADLTRTRLFLRLQPYRWSDMWPACADVLQAADSSPEEDVPLAVLPELGARFAERCFNVQVPASPWLAELQPARRSLRLQALLAASDAGRIRIWPIYGVRTGVASMLRRPVANTLFTLCCAALVCAEIRPGPPVVIVVLDRVIPGVPERPLARLRTLLAGGRTRAEEGQPQSANARRVAFTREIGAKARVNIRASVGGGTIGEHLRWVEQVRGRVQVLNLGPVSTVAFRRCFARAQLPPVFEGTNTASLALSLGRPYLHVGRVDNALGEAELASGSLYPSAYVHDARAPRLARVCQHAANQITHPLESWSTIANPAERLATFLTAVEPHSSHELAAYFQAVAAVYSNPAHDRLRLALAGTARFR